MKKLKSRITVFEDILNYYKDFPKEGITFIDIIPTLRDREKFAMLIDEIAAYTTAPNVATVEARGFLFAAPLLIRPGTGVENVIPIRKKGKLPFSEGDLVSVEIVKEYGHDNVFFRKSDIAAGKVEDGVMWVSVLDDVLATGGTAKGIADALNAVTVNKDGKEYPVRVKEFVFLCEIDGLPGRALLESIAPVHSIMHVTE
ncbi:MAG: hypothetical protein IJM41_00890 [Bacteroidales bacterium]|nr:hypothetical protein [Bacteroidales bacterium]